MIKVYYSSKLDLLNTMFFLLNAYPANNVIGTGFHSPARRWCRSRVAFTEGIGSAPSFPDPRPRGHTRPASAISSHTSPCTSLIVSNYTPSPIGWPVVPVFGSSLYYGAIVSPCSIHLRLTSPPYHCVARSHSSTSDLSQTFPFIKDWIRLSDL